MAEKSTNVRSSGKDKGTVRYQPTNNPWLRRVAHLHPALAARLGVFWFTQPRHWPRPNLERDLLKNGTAVVLKGGVHAWSFGAGPAVILVHGWEGRGAQLGAFVEPLVSRGFRVLTFDASAHGSSPGSHATILSWLPPLFELAERFGDPAGVIAHSFGCPAVSLALRRGLHASSVVYLAPPDALDGGARTFAKVTGIGQQGEQALKRRLGQMTGLDFEDQRVATFGPKMQLPLLVVHDEADTDVRIDAARSYARCWPDSQVFTTRGLGHRKILKAPQVIDRVVEFVTCHRAGEHSLDRWLNTAHLLHAPRDTSQSEAGVPR